MPLPIWPLNPTPGAIATGGNLLVINGFCGEFGGHKAVDLRIYFPATGGQEALPDGTDVVAVAAGTVQASTFSGDGRGGYVQILHDTATPVYTTRYLHLSDVSIISPTDVVTQGQLIGKSGGAKGAVGAGASFGGHLHFDMFLGDSSSPAAALDPCHYLPHLDGLYHCSVQGAASDNTCGDVLSTCGECTQAQAQSIPVSLITTTFKAISQIIYSVTTSQGDAMSKDCLVMPATGKPDNKPGINHIASMRLAGGTGASMTRQFDIVLPPSPLSRVRGFQDLGMGKVTIQSPATVEAVQAAFDAILGAGNVVVTPADVSALAAAKKTVDLFVN